MAFRSLCLRNRKEFSVFTLIYKQNQTFLNMRDFKDIKVAVAGTGYVGLSIATLLAQHHHVTAVDVIPEKEEYV